MARKANYRFERFERERAKAAKKTARTKAKAEKAEKKKAEKSGITDESLVDIDSPAINDIGLANDR